MRQYTVLRAKRAALPGTCHVPATGHTAGHGLPAPGTGVAPVRRTGTTGTVRHSFLHSCQNGAIAQSGERLLCKQEVAGSIPAGSMEGGRGMNARHAYSPRGVRPALARCAPMPSVHLIHLNALDTKIVGG